MAARARRAAGMTIESEEAGAYRLLAEAVGHLKSYLTMLLESRGGAASAKEQYALGLSRLIERAEAALGGGVRQSSWRKP
jgi:hypothetical protein